MRLAAALGRRRGGEREWASALAWAETKAGKDGPPEVGAGAAGCWATMTYGLKTERGREGILFFSFSISFLSSNSIQI